MSARVNDRRPQLFLNHVNVAIVAAETDSHPTPDTMKSRDTVQHQHRWHSLQRVDLWLPTQKIQKIQNPPPVVSRNVWGAPVSPWPTMSRGNSVFANVSLCQVACLESWDGWIWWIWWIFKTTIFSSQNSSTTRCDIFWYFVIFCSKAEVTRISCICWKFQRVSWSWSLGSGLDSLQRSTKAFGRERKIPCGTLDTPHRRSQNPPSPNLLENKI